MATVFMVCFERKYNEFNGIPPSANEHWDQLPFIRIALPISRGITPFPDCSFDPRYRRFDFRFHYSLFLSLSLSLLSLSFAAFVRSIFSNVLIHLANVFDVSKMVLVIFLFFLEIKRRFPGHLGTQSG